MLHKGLTTVVEIFPRILGTMSPKITVLSEIGTHNFILSVGKSSLKPEIKPTLRVADTTVILSTLKTSTVHRLIQPYVVLALRQNKNPTITVFQSGYFNRHKKLSNVYY